MAEKNLIDQREYERTLKFVEDFRLSEHRPEMVARLRSINVEHPTSLDMHVWQTIAADVARFREFHEKKYPFVVAPPGVLAAGDVPTGLAQLADNQPVFVSRDEIFRHFASFGMTGAAKTTLAQTAAENLKRSGFHLHIIEGKRDAEHFPVRHHDMLVLTPDMPIPLLDREHLGPEHARLFTRTARRTLYGAEGLEQVATEALSLTYDRCQRPTLVDLHRVLVGMERKGDTYTRRDRINGLALRISRIIDSYPGWATTPPGAGLDLDLLRTRSWYFGFTVHTPIEDFLSTFLIEWLFARKRLLNDRTTCNAILIDEAVPMFHDDTPSGEAPLVPTLGLLREFQVAIVLTANTVRALPAKLKSNLYFQVVMNLSDQAEVAEVSKTFGLTASEQEFLKHELTRGLAICFLADRWRHAVLAKFEPPVNDKVVSAAAWEEAKQRTRALARTQSVAAAASPIATVSPAPTPATPVCRKTTPNSAALNPAQRTYLEKLSTFGVATVKEMTDALGLHPQAADRIRKTLGPLNLICESRINVGSGRGKQHAIALMPTQTAYEMLGTRPPRLGRGSGPQHAWVLRTLRDRIPRAVIEGMSGADITIVFDDGLHRRLRIALRAAAGREVPLHTGDTIAIEAETDASRTLEKNLDRDKDLSLIVVGVRRAHLEVARRIAKPFTNTIVIDVFALLDKLQEEP